MWLISVLCWRKSFAHIVHVNGFSPVWIFTWLVSVDIWRKALSQCLHLYGRSSVWIFIWLRNVVNCRNLFLQTWHSFFLRGSSTFTSIGSGSGSSIFVGGTGVGFGVFVVEISSRCTSGCCGCNIAWCVGCCIACTAVNWCNVKGVLPVAMVVCCCTEVGVPPCVDNCGGG